jgi:hypothetical protein
MGDDNALYEAANRFLREVYLPTHNARFVEPRSIAEKPDSRSGI